MTAPEAAALPVAQPKRRVSRLLDRRFVAVGAPIVYSVALAVTVATWGLPVARDQLFFWIGLGLLAFSVSAWRSWGQLVIEWLPFFALLAAYDWLRGAVAVAPAQAHLMPQLDFDKFLFFGTVPTVWLQQHLWHPTHFHWYDYGIWGVYMTHFFAVWVVAAVIWHTRRPLFRRYAVMVIGVTVGAFLTYWLYPAQPPWLPSGGPLLPPIDRIVPQVWDQLGVHTLASVYENHDFVNPVAAMPSLHAAYPFMLMLFFWSAGRWVRIALGAYTLAMAFTLVYGGEHFVTDILAGWALALAVHGILRAWQARKHSLTRGDAKSASPAPTV